jgi:uncharacterized protein YndB with AHSA1/START domain
MEQKTQIKAQESEQQLFITRDFDLPVELLFKAYTEPELIEQWMGNSVIFIDNKKLGAYHFEVRDSNGNVILTSIGTIHDFVSNQKIIRTFEMLNTPYPVQLELLEFEKVTDSTSKLTMQVIYQSVNDRNRILKLPFAFGLNNAHNKLQEIANKLK